MRSPWLVAPLLLAVAGLPIPPARAESVPAVVEAVADTQVCAIAPDVPGHASADAILSATDCEVYVRFRLPAAVKGNRITSALLHARYRGGSSIGTQPGSGAHELAPVAGGWPETISWNERPGATGEAFAIFDTAANAPLALASFDVSELVQTAQAADGEFAVRIAALPGSPPPGAYWETREGGSGFRLRLTLEAAAALQPGELAFVGTLHPDEPEEGIVAIDPDTHGRRLLTPLLFPHHLAGLVVDPVTGDLLVGAGYHEPAIFRIGADGDPGTRPAFAGDLLTAPVVLLPAANGEIWLAQPGEQTSRVVAVDSTTGSQRVLSEGPLLDWPIGIAVEPSGSLLVLVVPPSGEPSVVRVDPATGAQSVVSTGDLIVQPSSIAVDPAGRIYVGVSGPLGTSVVEVDSETGVQSPSGPMPPLADPFLFTGPAGDLFAASVDLVGAHWFGADIFRRDETADAWVRLLEDPLHAIGGVAWAPDGTLLFTANSLLGAGSSVRALDVASGETRTIAALLSPHDATIVSLDAKRRLLVVGNLSDRLLRIDPATGRQTLLLAPDQLPADESGFPAGLSALTWGPDGRLFALHGPERALVVLDPDTGAHQPTAAPPGFHALAPEPGRTLLAIRHDLGEEPAVLRVDPDTGAVAALAEGGLLDEPADLAVAADGRILVADRRRHAVIAIDPENGEQAILGANLILPHEHNGPHRVWVDGGGRIFAGAPGLREISPAGEVTLLSRHGAGFYTDLAPVLARCADGFDNDDDGLVDWPEEPNCASPADDQERHGRCGLGVELVWLAALLRRRPRA